MSFKKKLFVNTIWSISSQIVSNAIALIGNIIFSRYLTVYEFGQLGIIMFFVTVANVLIEGGLGGALVRKENSTASDFSTVFIVNLLISLFLYAILYFSSGLIAGYYGDDKIQNLLIVIGLIYIINAFTFTQTTRLVKDLQFKRLFFYNTISSLIATILGVMMLKAGYGIWAVVYARIATASFYMIILWIREGGLGRLSFSISSFKALYAFGINTSAAAMIDAIFNNIYQLVLGRFFSISEVGLFYQARKLQDVPNSVIFGSTNSVIFSSLAKFQNDQEQFILVYRKVVLVFSVIMGLITTITVVYSKEIILLLYGSKWISSSFYLNILALASFFYVHEMFNRVIYKIFNKTKIVLLLELLSKSILTLSIVLGIIVSSIKILLFGFLLASSISYLVNNIISRTIIKTKTWHELIYLLKVLFAVSISCLTMYYIRIYTGLNGIAYLVLLPIVAFMYLLILRIIGIRFNILQLKEVLFNKSS